MPAAAVGIERESSLAAGSNGALGYDAFKLLHIVRAYIFDWVVLVGIFAGVAVISLAIKPRKRIYNVNDEAYEYPELHDTVPFVELLIISVGVPAVALILTQLVMRARVGSWNMAFDVHHFVLAFGFNVAITLLWTSSLKVAVGRIRPSGPAREASGKFDWNQSYPSGHTSMAFCGLTFMALYLLGKIGLMRQRGMRESGEDGGEVDPFRGGGVVVFGVVLLPLALATFVGASRLTDYAHDFSDVNAGAAIGVFGAFVGYLTYFPGPGDEFSRLPRPLALQARLGAAPQKRNGMEI